jgi:hypothetical protein
LNQDSISRSPINNYFKVMNKPLKRLFETAIILVIIRVAVFGSGDARGEFTTDIQLSLVNGKIETAGGVSTYEPPLDGRVFSRTISRPDTTSPFSASSPGFASLAGFLQPGEQIRFDIIRELLYWNGSQLAPSVPTMTIFQFANSVTISANDTDGKPGLLLGGAGSNGLVHIHVDYELPTTAPAGVYGLMLTVGPAGTATFEKSDPVLVAFRRGVSIEIADQGVAAMAALLPTPVPVPEPSGLGLAAGAAVVIAVVRRHYMQKRTYCKSVANTIGLL